MVNSTTNPKVDDFLSKENKWQNEFKKLRMIILDFQLKEEFKWGKPCYTFENKGIVLLHGFKEYCAILFFKGSLLKDENKILVQQTENVQAGRQIRFKNINEINSFEPIIKNYIQKAIEIEKSGIKADYKKSTDYKIPIEFQNKLNEITVLKTAFETLTQGRQRAYIIYFSQPKQTETRKLRVEKYISKIIDGKGLND